MSRSILLSAGGTGGHLFPAESLAHELKRRGWTVHLATDHRVSRYAENFPADAVHTITSATPGSKNPVVLARTMMALWKGFREASVVLQRLKPAAVVGFGGYPTLPPLFAATRRGIPTVIHEQNAVMGRANRALASRVTLIAGGFLPQGSGRHASKTLVTGNPVRPAVIHAAETAYDQPKPGGEFRLLVFGGSQGAQYFSLAVPAAIARLNPGQRSRLNVVQQARREDEESVREGYTRSAVRAKVAPFFDDLAQKMAKAHLVIARGGASTVSEIGVIGRPAILVPYPYALDHDQAANAAALQAAGGAEVHVQSSLTPERLSALIAAKMDAPEELGRMAAAARATGRPEATRLLADAVEAIAAGKSARDVLKEKIS